MNAGHVALVDLRDLRHRIAGLGWKLDPHLLEELAWWDRAQSPNDEVRIQSHLPLVGGEPHRPVFEALHRTVLVVGDVAFLDCRLDQ